MMMTKSVAWTAGGSFVLCMAIAAVRVAPPESVPAAPSAARGASPRHIAALPQVPDAAMPRQAAPAANQAPLHAVEMAVQRARAGGAGEDEVYRLRSRALPAQTIAMLTEREQAEQQWTLRVDAWRAERAKLDPDDAAAQRALRMRMFGADEQTRLDAYEAGDVPRLILP